MTQLALFDYGAGNIFSLKNSFEKLGATVKVITDFDSENNFSGLLLPGVGNFDPAIKSITEKSKKKFSEFVSDNTPVLGICLGMEMYFQRSDEGKEKGLGVIDGEVITLPDTMKVPHMGWNDIQIKNKQSKLLQGVKEGSWVYFVHSYLAKPDSYDVVSAESDYGIQVPAVIEKGNFFGTQFHPEKSGPVGKIMLENFLQECRK
ncbi:MAG: imidazole glycerol phosphate synthase subunit HisH [Nitrosopumilaceae archaeon]|nr:imidazole glycerol phosphate synthase subunit HisH [Nitrosopumilaceae archaeon]